MVYSYPFGAKAAVPFWDKPLKFQLFCPQNWTAVLQGSTPIGCFASAHMQGSQLSSGTSCSRIFETGRPLVYVGKEVFFFPVQKEVNGPDLFIVGEVTPRSVFLDFRLRRHRS